VKIRILPILIAAPLILGCGSDMSKEKNDILSQLVITQPDIEVIGLDIGVDNINGAEFQSVEDMLGDADTDISHGYVQQTRRVICWGDSLTEGTGGDGISFPDVVEDLSGCEVKNYGVYCDRASLIAARQGANPQRARDLSYIPADPQKLKVNIVGENGAWEMWLNFGDAGVNPCYIDGVEGTLSIDPDTGSRYFTRTAPGEAVSVTKGEFETAAMRDMRDNDILVIWSGSSDGLFDDRSIGDIIKYQRAMLKYANCDDYIIINFTAKCNIGDDIDEWNRRLEEEYGEHYFDIRSYLMNEGLKDAGIEATPEDIKAMEEGHVPQSLRSDDGHFNAIGYRLIGQQVYKKLLEMGYIN